MSDFKVVYGLTATGPVTFTAGTTSSGTTSGTLVVTGGVGISGALNATTKSFSIPHPTKPGMTLRHGSLEGPEFGVYLRGNSTGEIIFPDYWKSLVDFNTITVSLTPIGNYQQLYVKKIDNEKIVLGIKGFFSEINCQYLVIAERKDVEKLIIEGF